jgi:hypothetical protein
LLGLDVLIIGRQVTTDYGGKIDLLGIDAEGDLALIELKRDRTPREIVAQILDYASWIADLQPKRVHEIADDYFKLKEAAMTFRDAFSARFGVPVPENLNTAHSMLVVATELDESSKRIVEYLAKRHGLEINTAFFQVFRDGALEYVTADWLMDQEEVRDRSEARTKAPWSGYWFANTGDGTHRSWEDERQYGFLAAGTDAWYSDRLKQLTVGDKVYAYQRGTGYVGFGEVTALALKARDFKVDGKLLAEVPLKQPNLLHDPDDDARAEYVVPIRWSKAIPIAEARTFKGAFANQNTVCKLRDSRTLEFLKEQFGA